MSDAPAFKVVRPWDLSEPEAAENRLRALERDIRASMELFTNGVTTVMQRMADQLEALIDGQSEILASQKRAAERQHATENEARELRARLTALELAGVEVKEP